MKLSLKLVLLSTLLLAAVANAVELAPYVGADAQLRHLSLKGSNGVSPRRVPGLNAYAGLQVLPNLGLEVGANVSRHQKNTPHTKLKGLHLSALGSYPLSGSQTSVIGSAGVSHIRYAVKNNEVRVDYRKLRPRLAAGVQYDVNNCVAWRTLGSWEGSFGKKDIHYNPKQAFGASTGLVYKF